MISDAMATAIADLFQRQGKRAGEPPQDLEQERAQFAPAGPRRPIPPDVVVKDVNAHGVSAHWLIPPGTADSPRVVLFLHGGGFRLGSLASDGELAARIGREAHARVLFVEYRLAPEHPFPAAMTDVMTAWLWLLIDERTSAPSIAIAGDSAGGGLAMSLLIALRDAANPLPGCAVLMSPTVDLTGSGASMTERVAQDPISTPGLLQDLARDYLAGADPSMPAASPLFASLEGLPPLLVQVGTADLLLSDSERLAAAARTAGVQVELHIGEGLPHVYPLLAETPEAQEATTIAGAFVRSHLARGHNDN